MTAEGSSISDDLFDCFGSGDDDENDDKNDHHGVEASSTQPNRGRDPACGVLTFHRGTEQALCNFVEREMEVSTKATVTPTASQRVLESINTFCYTRHWMMNLGDGEKANALIEFLGQFYEQASTTQPLLLVELGTYCGYSAILMAQTLRDMISASSAQTKFHIVSVDVDPNHQQVAKRLVQLAELEDCISFVLLPLGDNNTDNLLTICLEKHFQSMAALLIPTQTLQIHFLFIDHDKDMYVSDLQQLEKSGWIRHGTHVAADNVVFFDTPYRAYIQQRKDQTIVSSRLVLGQLEYIIPGESEGHDTANFRDGIELTVYLKDPPAML